MQFEVEFQTEHLMQALEAAREVVANPDAMLLGVGEALLRVNQKRHDAGLAPDGEKWKALAESTLKYGGKRKGGILKKSGDMLASFKYGVNAGVLRLGFDGDRDSKLANIHHSGSKPYTIEPKNGQALKLMGIVRKRVNHPGLTARPLVGFPDSDQRLSVRVIESQLGELINDVR